MSTTQSGARTRRSGRHWGIIDRAARSRRASHVVLVVRSATAGSAGLQPEPSIWCARPRTCSSVGLTGDTLLAVSEVSIRELRNHGGEVIDRIASGESMTVTRDGRPVAELRPLRRAAARVELLKRTWARLPALDAEAFRRDIDHVVDASL